MCNLAWTPQTVKLANLEKFFLQWKRVYDTSRIKDLCPSRSTVATFIRKAKLAFQRDLIKKRYTELRTILIAVRTWSTSHYQLPPLDQLFSCTLGFHCSLEFLYLQKAPCANYWLNFHILFFWMNLSQQISQVSFLGRTPCAILF
jgi:hypothetical protein